MNLLPMQPGDIIIQSTRFSPVAHTLIWIDNGERCVAEASHGNLDGVRLATRNLFAIAEYVEGLPYSTVYRCKITDIARIAADCARKWGTVSTAESHIHPGKTYKQVMEAGKKATLPTPYNMRERKADKGPWTESEGLFAMARAFVREQKNMPLSINQGMGCAGLVTYCYQVASLKAKFGDKLPTERMALMAEFVELKNAANVAWIAGRAREAFDVDDHAYLRRPERKQTAEFKKASHARDGAKESFRAMPVEEQTKILSVVPAEVLRDAKSTRTEALEKQLKTEQNFQLVGYLVGNKPKGHADKVGIVAPKDAPEEDDELQKQLAAAKGWM